MHNHLSIRAYSRKLRGHSHDYHQLVLPLRGVINLELNGFSGKVLPGECVVIRAGEMHHFTANEEARFVVADMRTLPGSLSQSNSIVFSISAPLMAYLNFIEKQLEHQLNQELEAMMFSTFVLLLEQQSQLRKVDQRIRMVLETIHEQYASRLTIDTLASVACLSTTQFKKLFKQEMGVTALQYLTRERMERAQALLQHTDYPIQIVAERVGYSDAAAFSRRFSAYFGLSPREFSQ